MATENNIGAKTVLITGAGRGIGLEVVKTFLKESDFVIIATSRNVDNLIQIAQPRLHIIEGDLLLDYSMIIDQILKISSQLNIVINNAALVLNKLIENVTNDDLNKVMETNFNVPYKLCRDLLPKLIAGSHIVNISSMSGYQGSKKFKGLSVYSASKAALASLSECIANEWTEKNIFCNCLSLGAVDTEMIKVSIPGLRPTIKAHEMARYIYQFSLEGPTYFNGQVVPVTTSTL